MAPLFFLPMWGDTMAKMIPEQPSSETKSSAEMKLFRRLQMMEGTEDWTVLHSLAIAKHDTQSQGEADFVVVIPSAGIFVLEVKGGGISHFEGKWFSRDRFGNENPIKNPVEEASNAMHSIKSYIKNSAPSRDLEWTLFGFGVVFPDTTIHGAIQSVEIADEQIADFDDCFSPEDLRVYLLRLADYWKKRSVSRVTSPTAYQCGELIKMLRPSFEGRISLRSLIRNVENQVVELTENQQETFETITENDRCIIRGGAGTGKTIIALHFAKQKSDGDQQTGFFCYNRQLAVYLKKNVDSHKMLICDSFTEYMESIVVQAGHKPEIGSSSSARNTYYRETLPQLFMESFIELNLPQFENLILDEAQDLLTENYLEALDLILKDGLKNGRWYFFMDAEKQNLFQTDTKEKDVFDLLGKYGTHFTKCYLKDNCRNSVAIIEKIDAVFGSNTRHKHNDERGAEVSIKVYRKMSDQVEALETILRTLEREGINYDQIVILSPIRFQNSASNLLTGTPVTLDPNNRKQAVFFSTIHSFKGLESPVVILTDIDTLTDEARMNILYVGMTRAKSALYILAQEKVAKLLR